MKPEILYFAWIMGLVWGWCVFGIGYLFRHHVWSDKFVQAAARLYRGYGPTLKGSLVGAVWGFIDGYISGLIIAWLWHIFAR